MELGISTMYVTYNMYIYIILYIHVDVSALERTFSDVPGREKVRRRKLDELENLAPSPLIFTITLSTPSTSVTCITKIPTSITTHDIVCLFSLPLASQQMTESP